MNEKENKISGTVFTGAARLTRTANKGRPLTLCREWCCGVVYRIGVRGLFHNSSRTQLNPASSSSRSPPRYNGAGIFHFQVRHECSQKRFRDYLFWTRGSSNICGKSHGRQHVHFFGNCIIRRYRGHDFARLLFAVAPVSLAQGNTLALSGHWCLRRTCPLSRVKRTSDVMSKTSAFDPKRTWLYAPSFR